MDVFRVVRGVCGELKGGIRDPIGDGEVGFAVTAFPVGLARHVTASEGAGFDALFCEVSDDAFPVEGRFGERKERDAANSCAFVALEIDVLAVR